MVSAARAASCASAPGISSPWMSPIGSNSSVTGCCVSVLTKRVATILTSSTSPFRKRSRASARDRAGLRELGRVAVGELGDQLPARARDELRGLASGRDEDGRMRIVPAGEAEHVAVERAAQALVRRDQDDGALLDLAHLEQRMREVDRARRRLTLDAVEQPGERPDVDRGLLRLAHLRRGDHLHGFGDLRRAADRSDPPAEFAGAGHDQDQSGLNCSAAAFNSATSASSSALRSPMCASRSGLGRRQELGQPA